MDRTATFWTGKEAVRPDCAEAVSARKRSKAAHKDTEETARTE
jgi:hypothetical protein